MIDAANDDNADISLEVDLETDLDSLVAMAMSRRPTHAERANNLELDSNVAASFDGDSGSTTAATTNSESATGAAIDDCVRRPTDNTRAGTAMCVRASTRSH